MLWDIFLMVLNISIISCYTIIVVFVLRALLLKWERKYAYLLWFVVFINLCIPYRVSGPFSLVPSWVADFDISKQNETVQKDYLPNEEIVQIEVMPGDKNGETVFSQTSNEVTYHNYEAEAEMSASNGIPGTDSNSETVYFDIMNEDKEESKNYFLVIVWLAGIGLIGAWNIGGLIKLRKNLANAVSLSETDSSIKVAQKINSPFLWGIFSPIIYLPENIDTEERTYIIAHENYHKKRKDHIFKPVIFMISLIHWFNPFVWAAYILFVRDMEISCDEAVIANADEDIRKKYAASLLKYAARQNGYTLTPITFGEPSLKSRIKNILQYKKRNIVISAIILCYVIIIMLGLSFKPQQKKVQVKLDIQEENYEQDVIDTLDHDFRSYSAQSQQAEWKSGIIKAADGQNKYTTMLMESDIVSGKVSDFRTFSYEEEHNGKKNSIAYVMAGKKDKEAISGSLWFVGENTVLPVMQHITITESQMETIAFKENTYVIINYQADNRIDGRILPITNDILSSEIMPDIFGKKKIGDLEGTILCTNTAYDVECMVDSSGEKSVYNWYGQTTKEYAFWLTDENTYKEMDARVMTQEEIALIPYGNAIIEKVQQQYPNAQKQYIIRENGIVNVNICEESQDGESAHFSFMTFAIRGNQEAEFIESGDGVYLLHMAEEASYNYFLAFFGGQEQFLPNDITILPWYEQDWQPDIAYETADKSQNYLIGQEEKLTGLEQIRLDGLVPYYGIVSGDRDNMELFFQYCNTAVATTVTARRRMAYEWINKIGKTESFEVYGTNLIDTVLIRTMEGKYLRINHPFSSNYSEVPALYESDFDKDGEQELVLMGGFGYHGTGLYQEQLFIVDKGTDGVWGAYEFSEEIYLPVIEQHISSVYSEGSLKLQIDGEEVSTFTGEEAELDPSSKYCVGSQEYFGYGECGIVEKFKKDKIVGAKDNENKKIILDTKLGIYSDTNFSGIFPGDHFIAAFSYKGEGNWQLEEYRYLFEA